MTKKGLIILISFLSVVCLLMTGGFIYLLVNNFEWGSIELGLDFSKPKLLDSITYENVDVEEINIDSKALDVYIEESSDDKYSLEIYVNNKNIDYSFDNIDKKVTFKAHNNKGASIILGYNTHGKIVVKIPKENNLYTFNVDAKVGDIKVGNFEGLNGSIKNTTGDLEVNKFNDLSIDLGTGDIKLKDVSSVDIKHNTGDIDIGTIGDLTIQSKTGDINIDEVNLKMDITSKTGDIKINKVLVTSNSKIDNTTGDITIKEVSGSYVDATSKIGDVKVNNNDRYAEYTLKIQNKTGDIKIN